MRLWYRFSCFMRVLGVWLSITVCAYANTQCYHFATDLPKSGVVLNRAPVCKALINNFNKYCDRPPMVCELHIHPHYLKLLSVPRWKRVEPAPSIEEIEKFIRAPWEVSGRSEGGKKIWAEWQSKVEAAIQRGTLTLDEAYVDLLNRGKRERVLRLLTGECTSKNHATPDSDSSILYKTEGININFASEVYTQHKDWAESWGSGGELFTFQGQTYDYGMGKDLIVVNRFFDSTKHVIGNKRNICIIQKIYKEPK